MDLSACLGWEGEIREVKENQIIEEIMAENFPFWMNTINPWIQES